MSRRGRPSPFSFRKAEAIEPAATDDLRPEPVEIKRRSLGIFGWLAVAGLLLGVVLVGVWLAWWIWLYVIVYIPIQNQEVGITLPPKFQATAEVSNMLDVAMKGEIAATVPFKQTLTVPLRGRYDFDVEMDARVPVQFEVIYDGVIPVDTSAEVTIRTGLNYKNLKSLRNLTIKTSLPLKFPLPVNLKIPVDDVIDLTYSGHLSADIDQDLVAPVDTLLRTRLPIDQTIRTPVTAAIPLEVMLDQEQVRMIITEMDVPLRPSRMLGFGIADEAERQGPVRGDNPYGPQDRGESPSATR